MFEDKPPIESTSNSVFGLHIGLRGPVAIFRHYPPNSCNFLTYDWLCSTFPNQMCFALNVHQLWTITHWGRVTHICVSKLTIIGSDNGLSPGRRQAIIWTNAGILLIGPLETNFSEILIAIEAFSFKKMHLKISSAKWRIFCLGLNLLTRRVSFWWRSVEWSWC